MLKSTIIFDILWLVSCQQILLNYYRLGFWPRVAHISLLNLACELGHSQLVSSWSVPS